MKRFFILLCLLLMIISSYSTEKKDLIVFGMTNELESEDWRDVKIGFGMQSILSEAFYSTDKFINVEEKTEIREKIRKVSQKIWENNREVDYEQETNEIKPEVDFIAYGRVFYYGAPRTRASIGVFHAQTTEVIIKVEIFLENLKTSKRLKAIGTGNAQVSASSLLFKVRDDVVLFDETAVGKSTRQAINKAVEDIIKKFEKIE